MDDVVAVHGHLFLGTRLKRLGERMQADVLRVLQDAGVPVQPAQYPLLAALDRHGPLTVTGLVEATGVSQPGVTRNLNRLQAAGLVRTRRNAADARHKTVTLTAAGQALLERSKREIWPRIETAVRELCAGLDGPLLGQLAALETALAHAPLDRRASAGAGLEIIPFRDELAGHFHDINTAWIEAMFTLEATDRDVLENPRARIIDPGGDILFVAHRQHGIIGTCALQKTGPGQFELTKMGVTAAARGLGAGDFLLRAMLRRAEELGATRLYLLTNSKCAAAIHLYEKLGFVHDPEIMAEFGARYRRSDVAMLYRGEKKARGAQPPPLDPGDSVECITGCETNAKMAGEAPAK